MIWYSKYYTIMMLVTEPKNGSIHERMMAISCNKLGSSQLVTCPRRFTSKPGNMFTLPSSREISSHLYVHVRSQMCMQICICTYSEFYLLMTGQSLLVSCASTIQRALGPDSHTSRYYTYRRISSYVMKASDTQEIETAGFNNGWLRANFKKKLSEIAFSPTSNLEVGSLRRTFKNSSAWHVSLGIAHTLWTMYDRKGSVTLLHPMDISLVTW